MKPLHAQKEYTNGKCPCCIRYRHSDSQASYKGGNSAARFKAKQELKDEDDLENEEENNP